MKNTAFTRGIVLLAAGRGQRMRPLTDTMPKALLPVGGRAAIDWMLDAVLARSQGEVVVVTGFAEERVREHLASHGDRLRFAHNDRYEQDVNIVSVETGVAALQHPERGYLVIETDLLLDDVAWDALFAGLADDGSYWVCRGVYGPALTGGVVHADETGRIDVIDYRPQHDAACNGWPKMLGMLAVGPGEVNADRHSRQAAMARSIAQYYLMPWRDQLERLPCRVLQLDDGFAATYNTPQDFHAASAAFLAHCRHAA